MYYVHDIYICVYRYMYMYVYIYIYMCVHVVIVYPYMTLYSTLVPNPKANFGKHRSPGDLELLALDSFGDGSVNGAQFDAAGCTKGALSWI